MSTGIPKIFNWGSKIAEYVSSSRTQRRAQALLLATGDEWNGIYEQTFTRTTSQKKTSRVSLLDIFLRITINNDPFWQNLAFLSQQFLTNQPNQDIFEMLTMNLFTSFTSKGGFAPPLLEGDFHTFLSKLGKEIKSKRFTFVKNNGQ